MDLSKSGNIHEHYQSIGCSLLELEAEVGLYSFLTSKVPDSIQSKIAFIPNEVLESYLEDLLDFNISDEKLNIFRSNLHTPYNLIALLGLLLSVVFGLKLAYSGNNFLTASAGVLLIALPSGLIWHLSPKIAPNRRLFFAKVLSNEIDRRNGQNPRLNLNRRFKKLLSNDPRTIAGISRKMIQ